MASLGCRPQKTGVSVSRTDKGEQAFQQPIYLEGLQVSSEQQKKLFNTGFALNAALSKAVKAKSDAVYVQNPKLVLASCVVRQHKAITNVPMVSSLADPQSRRQRVTISNIAMVPNTSQASPEELRKSLEQQCNRLLPGSVTHISVADIISRKSQGIVVHDVKPSMNLDLVPELLI